MTVNEERVREILGGADEDGEPSYKLPPDWIPIAIPCCCAATLYEYLGWLREEVLAAAPATPEDPAS